MTKIEKMIASAETHGFTAYKSESGEAVHVRIPYVAKGGYYGVYVRTASTFRELNRILGY